MVTFSLDPRGLHFFFSRPSGLVLSLSKYFFLPNIFSTFFDIVILRTSLSSLVRQPSRRCHVVPKKDLPRVAGLAPLPSPGSPARGRVRMGPPMVVLLGAAPPLIGRPHGGVIHRPRRGFPARRCREILWSASSAISKTSLTAWSAWKGKQ